MLNGSGPVTLQTSTSQDYLSEDDQELSDLATGNQHVASNFDDGFSGQENRHDNLAGSGTTGARFLRQQLREMKEERLLRHLVSKTSVSNEF